MRTIRNIAKRKELAEEIYKKYNALTKQERDELNHEVGAALDGYETAMHDIIRLIADGGTLESIMEFITLQLNGTTKRNPFRFSDVPGRLMREYIHTTVKEELMTSQLNKGKMTDEEAEIICNNLIEYPWLRRSIIKDYQLQSVCVKEAENGGCVLKKHENIHLIDLGLPSGTLWADRNLGADAPEEYGDYYRWGETVPFTEKSPKYEYKNIGNNIQGTQFDAVTVNLGKPYMMPTLEQQKELIENCVCSWTSFNGVKGVKVTGPNGNHIFFPASGFRNDSNSQLFNGGSYGYCWSASAYSSVNGHNLYFNSSNFCWNNYYRAYGFPVRPVVMK